jgi:WD40 repeat protein
MLVLAPVVVPPIALSCAGRVPAPSPAPAVACSDTAPLRAHALALLADGRLFAALRAADEADAKCPSQAEETRAIRTRAMEELRGAGDSEALVHAALDARARGDMAGAHRLFDRAVFVEERTAGKSVVAGAFRPDGAGWPYWANDGSRLAVSGTVGSREVLLVFDRPRDGARAVLLRAFDGGSYPQHVEWNKDGTFVALEDATGVGVYDVVTGKRAHVSGSAHAFSPSGKLLVVGRVDAKAVDIYAMPEVRLVASIQAGLSKEGSVRFSRDERWLFLQWGTAAEGTIAEVASGRVVKELRMSQTSFATSHDGTMVAAMTFDDPAGIEVFDLPTVRTVRRFTFPHEGWYGGAVAFSPDDRKVAFGLGTQRLRVLDLPTGKVDELAPKADPISGMFISAQVESLAFTEDGRRLCANATYSTPAYAYPHCDFVIGPSGITRSPPPPHTLRLAFFDADAAHVTDLPLNASDGFTAEGRRVVRYDVGHTSRLATHARSPDGALVALTERDAAPEVEGRRGLEGAQLSVVFVDAKTKKAVRTIELTPRYEKWGFVQLFFSPDSRSFAARFEVGDAMPTRVYDVATGALLAEAGFDATFTPDGAALYEGGKMEITMLRSKERAHILDPGPERPHVPLEKSPFSLPAGYTGPAHPEFSLDQDDHTLRVTAHDRRIVFTQPFKRDPLRPASVAPSGQALALTETDGVRVLEIPSGRVLRVFPRDDVMLKSRSSLQTLTLDASGRHLAINPALRDIDVWDVATGVRLWGTKTAWPFCVSPHTDVAFVGTALRDMATGQELWSTEPLAKGDFYDAVFAADARSIWLKGSDESRVVDAATGRTLASFASRRHIDRVAISFGRAILDGGDVYSFHTGKRVLELEPLAEDAAIATAPSGAVELLGKAKARVRSLIKCRIGTLVLDFDACADRLETPGLTERVLGGEEPAVSAP